MSKRIKVTNEQLQKIQEMKSFSDVHVDVDESFTKILDNLSEHIGAEDYEMESEEGDFIIDSTGHVEYAFTFILSQPVSGRKIDKEISEFIDESDIRRSVEVEPYGNKGNMIKVRFV